MIRCWDYFMRRKARLLPIMVLFLLSSLLSYNFLRQQQVELPARETHNTPVTYINVSLSDPEDSADDIEVPHTGGLIAASVAAPVSTTSPVPLAPTILATVISPQEVTDLEVHNNDTEQNIEQAIEESTLDAQDTTPDAITDPVEDPTETATEVVIDVLAPDALPQYPQSAPAPATVPIDSRTPFVIMLLIGCSITGGFWLYFLYEHYTR